MALATIFVVFLVATLIVSVQVRVERRRRRTRLGGIGHGFLGIGG